MKSYTNYPVVNSWISDSNRWKHLAAIALVTAVTFAFLQIIYGAITWQSYAIAVYVALGVSAAMEFKDVHHANGDSVPIIDWDWSAWDWLDILAGLIGCAAVCALVFAICLIK